MKTQRKNTFLSFILLFSCSTQATSIAVHYPYKTTYKPLLKTSKLLEVYNRTYAKNALLKENIHLILSYLESDQVTFYPRKLGYINTIRFAPYGKCFATGSGHWGSG